MVGNAARTSLFEINCDTRHSALLTFMYIRITLLYQEFHIILLNRCAVQHCKYAKPVWCRSITGEYVTFVSYTTHRVNTLQRNATHPLTKLIWNSGHPSNVFCSSLSYFVCQCLWITYYMRLHSFCPQATDVGEMHCLVPATVPEDQHGRLHWHRKPSAIIGHRRN